MDDLSLVELPRWVKKPGDKLRVDTLTELREALADGWVLRLDPAAVAAAPVAASTEDADELRRVVDLLDALGVPASDGDGVVYAVHARVQAALEAVSAPEAEGEDAGTDKRKPGRPRKG